MGEVGEIMRGAAVNSGADQGAEAGRVPGGKYSVDARDGRYLQIGDGNTQNIYVYGEWTWSVGMAPSPLTRVSGALTSSRREVTAFLQRDLMMLAIDRPYLNTAWGGPADPRLRDDDHEILDYANMIMDFWRMAYHWGVASKAEVRLCAQMFFTGRIGRAYWKGVRTDRGACAQDRTERRFYKLVDVEYQAALGSPPAPDEPLRPSPVATPSSELRRGCVDKAGATRATTGFAAGAVVTAALGYVLGRRAAERDRGRGRRA